MSKPIVEVPLRINKLIFAALVLMVCTLQVVAAVQEQRSWGMVGILALCMVLALWWTLKYTVHYRICPQGLVVLILGLPVRTIAWSAIAHAEYIHTWLRPRNRLQDEVAHGQIIYITLSGCPVYYPALDMRWWHNLRHPFRAATIWLPAGNILLYTEAFRTYFPDFKVQP